MSQSLAQDVIKYYLWIMCLLLLGGTSRQSGLQSGPPVIDLGNFFEILYQSGETQIVCTVITDFEG